VTDPIKISGHMKYNVTGEDPNGDFVTKRRFREFAALSTVLKARWPGCYIPSIPEKKFMKSTD
jgi:sorting nexin-1/2/sorting nexin-4